MSRAPKPWPENIKWAIAESLDLWFRHAAALGRGDVQHAADCHRGAASYSRASLTGHAAECDRRRAEVERQRAAAERRAQR